MENENNIDPEEICEEGIEKAQELMGKPDKVEKLLKNMKKKLEGLSFLGDTLIFLPKMAMLVHSYLRKEYSKVPLASILSIIAAISYFVLPFDVIPDFLPVVGFLDDIGVVGLTLSRVSKELEEYMSWRLDTGLDEPEPAE